MVDRSGTSHWVDNERYLLSDNFKDLSTSQISQHLKNGTDDLENWHIKIERSINDYYSRFRNNNPTTAGRRSRVVTLLDSIKKTAKAYKNLHAFDETGIRDQIIQRYGHSNWQEKIRFMESLEQELLELEIAIPKHLALMKDAKSQGIILILLKHLHDALDLYAKSNISHCSASETSVFVNYLDLILAELSETDVIGIKGYIGDREYNNKLARNLAISYRNSLQNTSGAT